MESGQESGKSSVVAGNHGGETDEETDQPPGKTKSSARFDFSRAGTESSMQSGGASTSAEMARTRIGKTPSSQDGRPKQTGRWRTWAKSMTRQMTAAVGSEAAFSKFSSERSLRYDSREFGNSADMGKLKRTCLYIMTSQKFEMSVGCVIVLNFIFIAVETNQWAKFNAAKQGSEDHKKAESEIIIFSIVNLLFMCLYFLESSMRLWVQGIKFWRSAWNVFDLAIVLLGIACEIASQLLVTDAAAQPQMMRTLRIVRLFRISRIAISFPDLYRLVCGLVNCIGTLLWAGSLIFMMLTMFAIIAVEYLHPLMADLQEQGFYDNCWWCPNAFEDIMTANLTFFQIISGDGWSLLSRPLIEKHPWSGILMVAVIFTMTFGLLNLITAVIVDTASQARENDLFHMAKQKEQSQDDAWKCFSGLCDKLDQDASGDISIDELRGGLARIPELRAHFSVMGIEDDDIDMVFDILDPNNDGLLSHHEFATQLYKMKTHSVQTAVCFVKHYVTAINTQLKSLLEQLQPVMKPKDSYFSSQSSLEKRRSGDNNGVRQEVDSLQVAPRSSQRATTKKTLMSTLTKSLTKGLTLSLGAQHLESKIERPPARYEKAHRPTTHDPMANAERSSHERLTRLLRANTKNNSSQEEEKESTNPIPKMDAARGGSENPKKRSLRSLTFKLSCDDSPETPQIKNGGQSGERFSPPQPSPSPAMCIPGPASPRWSLPRQEDDMEQGIALPDIASYGYRRSMGRRSPSAERDPADDPSRC